VSTPDRNPLHDLAKPYRQTAAPDTLGHGEPEDRIIHLPRCREPQVRRHVSAGGVARLTCATCHESCIDHSDETTTAPTVEAPPVIQSNYRCRAHLDQPVTPRGRGCPTCAADLKRRKAFEPSDYEMEF
jgi:hypothetical protein